MAANGNTFQFTGRDNDSVCQGGSTSGISCVTNANCAGGGACVRTGLYYYRARYYSPTWGRFVSEDPVGSPLAPLGLVSEGDTWGLSATTGFADSTSLVDDSTSLVDDYLLETNPYAYVADNPLRYVDPDGLQKKPTAGHGCLSYYVADMLTCKTNCEGQALRECMKRTWKNYSLCQKGWPHRYKDPSKPTPWPK